jgi:hypothetical protein
MQVHAHDDEAAAAARIPQRVALLLRAQSELERGEPNPALDDFERAAMMLHASDAELGLIRSAMQDGQYRRALAFCAHTAGEHTDTPDGAALYAWLLRIGGQSVQSDKVLADLRVHTPRDPLVAAVESALASGAPVASGLLLAPATRMAPWPVARDGQAPPPSTARFAGNAVLAGDGTFALVPVASLAGFANARVWVRNGLGQATEAIIDRDDAPLASRGLARLRLRASLPVGASRESSHRAPFAGSPGYAVQFAAGNAPAWPLLAQGFLGSVVGDTDLRKLGFAADAGAPVLDAKGMLIGITLGTIGAQATWVPLSAVQAAPVAAAAPAPQGMALVAPDEIYEAGLRRALQVLVGAR